MTTILLKDNELTKNTIIGGNCDVDRYIPAIKAAQNTKIKPLLGKALYDKLCNDFKNGLLAGLYLELYEDYVKELVIHSSSEIYLSSAAYMISNNGITKAKTDSTQAITKQEVDYLVQASRKLYNSYEFEYLTWIKINGINIPEITVDEALNNSKILNIGGWSLKRPNNC